MKKLILHVGTPKTGTTSLQNYLLNNRDKLLEKGWDYPIFRSQRGSIDRNMDFILDDEINLDIYLKSISKLLEENNVILSSEDAYMFYRKNFYKLCKNLNDKQIYFEVVVFFREQVSFLKSLYAQSVKLAYYCKSFEEFKIDYQQYADYSLFLHELEELVPEDRINVLRYEKNDDTIGKFLKLLNIEIETTEQRKIENRSNVGFSDNAVDFCKNCARNMAFENNFALKLALRDIGSGIKGNNNERFEAIANEYEEGNAYIAKKYFNEDRLFEIPKTEKNIEGKETFKDNVDLIFAKMLTKCMLSNRFLFENRNKKIAIWGIGSYGRKFIKYNIKPDIIIDSDVSLTDKEYENIKITNFDRLSNKHDYGYIITVIDYKPIVKELEKIGFIYGEDMIWYGDLLI